MEKYCSIKKTNNNKTDQINDNNKKILLTTSFFYLENSYKSSYKYHNGLKKIIEFIETNEEYYLRIYYDETIFLNYKYRDLYHKIKTNKKIELFQYTCLNFIKKNPFHIGTFGTLIRFLPLFEKSDYYIIYIIDIDDGDYEYIKLYVDKLSNSDKKFIFNSWKNYGERYLNQFDNKFSNTTIANIFVKNYRFNLKIFTNFFELLTKSNEIFNKIENINNQFESFKNVNYQIKKTYGIDEYFLNIYLINTLESKDIGWIKEDYYFNYFIGNIIETSNNNDYDNIKKKYYLDIISILDTVDEYTKLTANELENLLKDMVNIHSNKNNNLKQKFFLNYYKFGELYKKITVEYYKNFFYIINEILIDDFMVNDFKGLSWYLKKNLTLFPKNIIENLKINFVKLDSIKNN